MNFISPCENAHQFDVQGLTFYVKKDLMFNIEQECIAHIFPHSDISRPITVDNVSAKSFEHFLRLTHGQRARLTEQNLIDLFILCSKYGAMHLYTKLHLVLFNTQTLSIVKKFHINTRFPNFANTHRSAVGERRRANEDEKNDNRSVRRRISKVLKEWSEK